MWRFWGLVCAYALAMDVPWVLANQRWGVYRGVVPVRPRTQVAVLWLVTVMLNALLITSVIRYSQKRHTPAEAFGIGAFIGVVSYTTFNATAVSVFKEWRPHVAAVDVVWGAVLYGAAAALAVQTHHPWRESAQHFTQRPTQ